MHTTMIRANITAYSTAVGPSSRFTKSTTKFVSFLIDLPAFRSWRQSGKPGLYHLLRLFLAGGDVDGGADAGERLVGVGAQGGDGGDAHHDDQGQHHGVFNG